MPPQGCPQPNCHHIAVINTTEAFSTGSGADQLEPDGNLLS